MTPTKKKEQCKLHGTAVNTNKSDFPSGESLELDPDPDLDRHCNVK